jgi:hypothetical protein
LRADLESEPIPEPIRQVLEARRQQRHTGANPVDSLENTFERLLAKHRGEA